MDVLIILELTDRHPADAVMGPRTLLLWQNGKSHLLMGIGVGVKR